MNSTPKNIEDPRISEMLDVIFRFAAGDLKARGTISEDDSALDGVMAGINILGEELEAYVAEKQQAENALRESERRHQAVIASALDAIIVNDDHGRIVDFNPAAERMFGYRRDYALGRELVDLVVPNSDGGMRRQAFREEISRGIPAFQGRRVEVPALHADGHEFPVELAVLRIEYGGRVSFAGFARDLTERKRQERALRESEERFQSILENVAEMFFIADGSLHPTYVSPRCLEIYGYSSDEMIARPTLWMETIHPQDRAAVASRVAEEKHKATRVLSEYRIIRKDGSARWVRSVSNPILGADGKLQRVYGTVTDITEFESLRSSLNKKEVLLKEIHHRVKNNLQIVISLMRLESRAFSEEKVRAALKDLETRIRAMALVHEHLYHSSDLAKIGFKDYLKGLCEELIRTYRADGGRIRLEIDAEAVALDIERAIPCGLIINELLTNAIKYAFPGDRKGVLRVAIRNTSDKEVEIVVSDDGIGIPETLDIRNTQTLGLQLVTTLAQNQLKGKLELERVGGTKSGTRFRIRFGI